MYQAIKAKLVKALKGGNYQQGRNALKRYEYDSQGELVGHQYCCLGVLCDLYAKEHNKEWEEASDSNIYLAMYDNTSYLPAEVMEWAGLETKDPVLADMGVSLSHLNDKASWNFNQLADLIEENL